MAPLDRQAPLFARVRPRLTAEVRPRTEAQRRREYVIAVVVGAAGLVGVVVLLVRARAASRPPSVEGVETRSAPDPVVNRS